METKEEIKWDGEFGALERITFVSDLLNKQVEIRNMLDLRTNIMIGFNSALIVFFASNFKAEWANSVFFVAALAAIVISMLFALMALKPSHFVSKKGQKESLFYHHQIDSKSEEAYKKEILETMGDETKIYSAYILETYNLTSFSNVPRKYYLNWSIRVLLYGIFISLALYLISLAPAFISGTLNLPQIKF
ncbi:MAG: Pycsar system effector family protein [Candidatus Berkelbacteria bacterium]